MNKAAAGVLLLALVGLGIWFFLNKEEDSTFTFQTSTAPGTVYKRILYWDYQILEKESERSKTPFSTIVQELALEEQKVLVTWDIIALNDSTTEVTANFEVEKNSKRNKFEFSGGPIPQENLKREIALLTEAFIKDDSFYNIQFEEKTFSPGAVCACISLSSTIQEKASLMMANIQHLSNFVSENNLKMDGKPRIKINSWNIEDDKIEYDFCFPLANPEGIEGNEKVFIREIKPQESLKATYNGNYMYSNLAWMALFNYAQAHEISVQKMPLEIFHDNPEIGGEALEWKTEIFLPIDTE